MMTIQTRGKYSLVKNFKSGRYEIVVTATKRLAGWGINQSQAFGILQELAGY